MEVRVITYEDIKKANESIKATDIGRGKEYVEVHQRIKAFRMVYPEGTIETEMLSNENGVCVFKATVKNVDIILGVGHAYEKEGSNFINKTSYIEVCETSACGRALGMCGFGIDTSVASYEEVANAMKNQEEKKTEEKKAGKDAINFILENTTPDQLEKLLKQKKVERVEDLSDKVAMDICIKLNERKMQDGRI